MRCRRRTGPDRRPRPRFDEGGATLLEVLVATSIVAVIMSIFTTTVVRMYRSAQLTEAVSTAQSQLTAAFARLDRQVRYAAQLSQAGVANGHWYVEYLSDPVAGSKLCTQLRVPLAGSGVSAQDGRLETRTWNHGGNPPAFTTLASLVEPATPSPFSHPVAGQLRVQLSSTVRAGPGQAPARRQIDVVFTLLNFSPDTADVDVCTQERTP